MNSSKPSYIVLRMFCIIVSIAGFKKGDEL